MSNMNRLHNCHNPHQGKFRKVLCLCSAGLLRSPTIAWVLSNPPYNCNTRAAGIHDYALVPMDEVLLEWADIIVAADVCHSERLPEIPDHIYCLNLPDQYDFRDPVLITAIQEELEKQKFPKAEI